MPARMRNPMKSTLIQCVARIQTGNSDTTWCMHVNLAFLGVGHPNPPSKLCARRRSRRGSRAPLASSLDQGGHAEHTRDVADEPLVGDTMAQSVHRPQQGYATAGHAHPGVLVSIRRCCLA